MKALLLILGLVSAVGCSPDATYTSTPQSSSTPTAPNNNNAANSDFNAIGAINNPVNPPPVVQPCSAQSPCALVVTAEMGLDLPLKWIAAGTPANPKAWYGSSTTPVACDVPGATISDNIPTGPIFCQTESGVADFAQCNQGLTPAFHISYVCTPCPGGRWTTAQIAPNAPVVGIGTWFPSTVTTIRCLN
jgi:hypothetical protein